MWRRKLDLICGLLLLVLQAFGAIPACHAQWQAPGPTAFSSDASAAEARFGSAVGAGAQWQPGVPGELGDSGAGFGGGLHLGCTGIDFNGFLRSFNPVELIDEMRNSLLSGAQAAASDFLIALAYSDPTISSVLDMLDKRYSARFSAFSQACNAEAARANGENAGARAMAEADDECFGQQIARGVPPTEAYRLCSVSHTFENLDIPAAASWDEYLRRYTNINVTRELEALLALLPDIRISQGALQFRPAGATVASLAQQVKSQANLALQRLDTGADPSTILACDADPQSDHTIGYGCLPSSTLPLVMSSAFQGARLLGPASRLLFEDALSSQIALSAIYSDLLDLYQQAARIDVRSGTAVEGQQADSRRRQLQKEIAELLREAEAQMKAQDARSQIVRSEILALEQVGQTLDARSRAATGNLPEAGFTIRGLLRAFTSGN